ncbi:MAG: glycosyltransferase [Burkholderiales bacterium]
MTAPNKIRIVCATRETREDFSRKAALGRTLAAYGGFYPPAFVELKLFERNSRGLPAVYNEVIAQSADDPAVLMFVHDDIFLCDFFWGHHVLASMLAFDIAGIAGNRRRVPRQPSWAFANDKLAWDAAENLSGVVGNGNGFPPQHFSSFGPLQQQVKLLDGVLLACRSSTLLEHGLRFDERFDFHFYDLDFCRQAEAKNLRMGTWPISVVHESGGAFGTPAWRAAYAKYLEKWGD